MSAHQQTLFVTGAGGHLGRLIVETLLEQGFAKIVAGTRKPQAMADLAAKGAKIVAADFDDPATLDVGFKGVDRLLIISTDAVGVPGMRLRQHVSAIDAARKAGVKHIVYTSMLKPEPGSAVVFAPDHYGTEQALEKSGLGWTILRNSWYSENLLGSLPQSLAIGKWYSSAGDGRLAHIPRTDAALAAAGALASVSPANQRFDITGVKMLTTAEIAKTASEVFDTPLEVVPVTDDQLAAGLKAAGVPEPYAPILVSFDANTRAGGMDVVSNAAEKLSGRPPQSLRDYFVANRAAFMPKG
jgi:NAD(P)H dehydrogenase (quinone)